MWCTTRNEAGHIVELLGHILAHAPHRAAAVGTHAKGLVQHILARQMVGQELTMRLGDVPRPRGGRRDFGGGFRLALLQPELQLVRFARQPLRRATKRHAPEPGHLHAKLLQLDVCGNEHGLQQADVVGQRGGVQ